MSSTRPLDSLPPTETLDIENGLLLSPRRVKLLLTVFRADYAVTPVDEWKLKRSLIAFFKASFSSPISLPDEDLCIKRFRDLNKRKRQDPVARGTLFLRDLGFLFASHAAKVFDRDGADDVTVMEKKFLDWRRSVVDKMEGMGLNIEGAKFRLSVAVPASDDFDAMKKEWEEHYAFGDRGYGRSQPDTIVLRGVPSRWFAEPRVSSKPSLLVTHTIFSTFGKLRNLNVAEDDDLGNSENEDDADIISGLHCKIVVQFEKYSDFYNSLKVLCSRSLQKQGSRLKADYEVTWARDGFFGNTRNQAEEKNSRMASGRYEKEAPKRQSQISDYNSTTVRSKRFKE